MKPEMEALGRRAEATGKWRWLPGTVDTQGQRVIGQVRNGCQLWGVATTMAYLDDEPIAWAVREAVAPPDFGDAPTLGALLELAREAWRDPEAYAGVWRCEDARGQYKWVVWGSRDGIPTILGGGATEAEAMLAALEAAP